MKKKAKSTYEEFIEDLEQKALLDKEYKELLMSELLSAAMKEDHILKMGLERHEIFTGLAPVPAISSTSLGMPVGRTRR